MPPTVNDMRMSLDDAQFFYEQLNPIVRGPEAEQDLETIRRYFRAYLHCWKAIIHYVREIRGFKDPQWIAWSNRWKQSLEQGDAEIFDILRNSRDDDTHNQTVQTRGQIAMGLFPLVMFVTRPGDERELVSCCDRGLVIAQCLIRDHLLP